MCKSIEFLQFSLLIPVVSFLTNCSLICQWFVMLETGENLYHFLYFSYWLDLTSILAWRIPWTEEPGRPWGRKELDTTEQLLDDV